MLRQLHPIIFLSLLLAFAHCKQKETKKDKKEAGIENHNQNYPSPPGYDLNDPVIFNLKAELDEISGLSYYAKDTSVFAICDDKGWLYKIHLTGKMQVEKWKFSRGADFEDVVLYDSTFFVLASNGQITSFRFSNDLPSAFDTSSLKLQGKNEFETLYFDPASAKLVTICKDCVDDSKKGVTAYSFDAVSGTFSNTPFFILDALQIAEKLGEVKIKFKPSAAARNPLTDELFILSSVNKALVTTDTKGNIKNVYPLNPKIYKQPEGITFTPSGNLVISNEGAEIGAANILIFKLKK